jgi:hypothetical protein
MDGGWGFGEGDDPDERDARFSVFEPDDLPGTGTGDDELTGRDADGVVTVAVDDAAEVVSIRLADTWQDDDVRRVLGAKVVEAVIAATAVAVAERAARLDEQSGQPASPWTPPAVPGRPDDDRPITREDALRLLHRVSADLAEFRQRWSAVADRMVSVTSRGGHVTVSGRQRQIGDVSIDQDWLYRARASEVETELCEALRAFAAESSTGGLSRGPDSGAISELLALVADPAATIRRIRRGSTR